MAPSGKKPRPEQEQTDRSLREERERADDTYAQKRDAIEADVDAATQQARGASDRALKSARAEADEKLAHAGASAEELRTLASEQRSQDAVLRAERATSDEQLHDERLARKRALASLLRLEREKTDAHLLLERARASDALEARDDFLGMVSHDLRTLLGGIALRAALLLRRTPEGEEGQATRRDAESIQRFTARMNRLIGDLLDVVSIDAGHLSVQPRPDDAIRLAQETVEAFLPSASAKGVSLEAHVARGSLLARFDYERILQVLANLLSNAIKFTPEGGHVSLRVEPVGDSVCFAVTDSGPGVPEAMRERLFERFWQVAPGDRRGLGLGLYISRCIVEAHGGHIRVESAPGGGSTFVFSLPGTQGGG